MAALDHVCLCQNVFKHRSKTFRKTLTTLPFVNRMFVLRKENARFLELAGIELKVRAGMFVSQLFKSVCTLEQSDQTSHFLPIDRPSKSDQTAWMG